jgi:single-strand DNA-binding protein
MTNTLKKSVQLVGNIGKDIILSSFDKGSQKASVNIAVSEFYVNIKGEKAKKTEWYNLKAWGKIAQLMSESLTKGNKITVQGRLISRTYQNKEGQTKYITEVIVSEFYKVNHFVWWHCP